MGRGGEGEKKRTQDARRKEEVVFIRIPSCGGASVVKNNSFLTTVALRAARSLTRSCTVKP